jgi:predicted NACHT family NTPase
LAELIRHHSGGSEFTVADLHAITRLSAILLVFDGLDEVADISKRQEVVEEIVKGVSRLKENAASLQVVVTSRPAAFANSPGLPSDTFSTAN